MNHLYESMRQHPDTGPVMELLELVDPVDEFSRALCLVRDCFSSSDTLRTLSRKKLKGLLGERLRLVNAYEVAVLEAARSKFGSWPKTFMEAMSMLPVEKLRELHAAYDAQVSELMNRPLGTN